MTQTVNTVVSPLMWKYLEGADRRSVPSFICVGITTPRCSATAWPWSDPYRDRYGAVRLRSLVLAVLSEERSALCLIEPGQVSQALDGRSGQRAEPRSEQHGRLARGPL